MWKTAFDSIKLSSWVKKKKNDHFSADLPERIMRPISKECFLKQHLASSLKAIKRQIPLMY